MNITVEVPRYGLGAHAPAEMQREDHLRTRIIQGNDSGLLPVPGLRSVERVRFPGGEHEAQVTRGRPVDHSLQNVLNITGAGYGLVLDVDGTTYLERSIFCNNGIWQANSRFWVTGEWDEVANPPAGALGPPPETMSRPLLTSGADAAGETGSRPGRKSAAQIAAEAAELPPAA
jgi:hypothetical protein